ncbi:MAG: class I SAM-dependent methyltransferase [Methanotrichaceae archaeon]
MVMIKDTTVSCYDSHSNDYDTYQSTVVPHYQDMLEIVAETCERYIKPNSKIIDLGCGTGNASLAVLRRLPARIFLIDGSSHMIDIALGKINQAHENIIAGYRTADLNDDSWANGLGIREYDAIVSTLVLEHLPFAEYKSVLGKCYDLLKPGGWLIAVEGYDEEGSDILQWFNREMDARKQKLDPKLSGFVARLRTENEVHYYSTKAQKEAWWKEAGFVQVQVVWQYLCIALMAGRRPD